MAEESLLNVYPIHYHFCSLICIATGFSCACPHITSLEITLDQKIINIFFKMPVYNCLQILCNSLYNLPCFASIQMNSFDIPSESFRLCCNRFIPSIPWLIKLNKICTYIMNIYFHIFLYPTGVGHHPAQICKFVHFLDVICLHFESVVTFLLILSNFILSQSICNRQFFPPSVDHFNAANT